MKIMLEEVSPGAVAAAGVAKADIQAVISHLLQTDPYFGTPAGLQRVRQTIVRQDGETVVRFGDVLRISVEEDGGQPINQE